MNARIPEPPTPLRCLRGLLSLLLGVSLVAGSCVSTDPAHQTPTAEKDTSAYVPLPLPPRVKPGYFVTKVDDLIRVWSTASLDARTEEDRDLVRAVEGQINQETWKHRAELIEILASGPPRQREVAAAALGFVKEPEVLSPLMNALSDPEPSVVEKALLGLGVLADSSTPLEPILYHLRTNPSARARINAAYALYRIVAVAGGGENVASGCREALRDKEWAVQTQCAGILGLLGDVDSIEALGEVLQAEGSTPCQSAAVALCRIARKHDTARGQVARTLVDSLPRLEPAHQPLVLEPLVALSGQDFGRDWNRWREWAYAIR